MNHPPTSTHLPASRPRPGSPPWWRHRNTRWEKHLQSWLGCPDWGPRKARRWRTRDCSEYSAGWTSAGQQTGQPGGNHPAWCNASTPPWLARTHYERQDVSTLLWPILWLHPTLENCLFQCRWELVWSPLCWRPHEVPPKDIWGTPENPPGCIRKIVEQIFVLLLSNWRDPPRDHSLSKVPWLQWQKLKFIIIKSIKIFDLAACL